MGKSVEVILLRDHEKLGKAGDIVRVKMGYARNYLIPEGIAVFDTPKNRKLLEEKIRAERLKYEREKVIAEELKEKLESRSFTITKPVGEEGKLFGSVTHTDIANTLKEAGFNVDKHNIKIGEPIKEIGVYTVEVTLHPEVKAKVKIWVVEE